jgi:hypothetical protein
MEDENKYIILKPDEDGNCAKFISLDEIKSYLDDLENIKKDSQPYFLTETDLGYKGRNPQDWDYYDMIILKVEKVIVPKPKIIKMVIEEE